MSKSGGGPNEQSNSIGNLLLHLSGNARQWIVGGIGGVADARDRMLSLPNATGLRATIFIHCEENAGRR